MKYIKKYANATKEELQRNGFIRGGEESPCLMCSEPTLFVDIYSEGCFCGDVCCNKFYEELSAEIHAEAS